MDKNNSFNSTFPAGLRPALGLLILCQTLEELGLDHEAASAITGLGRRELETPGYLIRSDQEIAFIEATLAANPRPDLAYLVGRRYHFGVFGIWGLALICSENLQQAFQVAQEFIELTHSFVGLELNVDGAAASLALRDNYPAGAVRNFVVERDLIVTLVVATEAAAQKLPLMHLEVAIPEPAHAKEIERLVGCPVVFNARHTRVSFAREILQITLPQANAVTWSACVRQCRELISRQHGERSFTHRVQRAIVDSAFKGIGAVAQRLAIPERTLRRLLQHEGASYRALSQQLRLDLAQQYLADDSLGLDQLAEKLGYSEAANFSHAFKRWSGMTPGEYRLSCKHANSKIPL
ncbi:AraC family transcriptional regulator [Zhongshania guokunii]|uniref:AraC family transcriptional regulator n=1 Tax=Zhongshania guokunii TaxID=641783 RepID=A0ABV3U881_9GAMM